MDRNAIARDPVQVAVTQIYQLYQRAAPALFGASCGVVILAVVLWDVVSHSVLIPWTAASLALYAVRHAMVRAFLRKSPTSVRALLWGRWLAVTSNLAGVLWGVGAIVLFPKDAVTEQAVFLVVLAGTCSGTVVAYSPLRAMYVPFALLLGIPTATMFFLYGGSMGPMFGGIVVMYVVIMILTGERMHAANQESIRLRFENRDLVESLVAEKRETENLNRSLFSEIAERRKV